MVLPEAPADGDYKVRVPEAERALYAPSSDPLESVEAFLRVQRGLVGDPSLELFNPGSRVMRDMYPVAPFEELERAHRAETSKPLRVVSEGDRAVVRSDRPAPGFVPILLERIDGTWRIDMVETWKNIFTDRFGNAFLMNVASPYTFGLFGLDRGGSQDIGAWDLGGRPLADVLRALESLAADDALARYLLAEVLFRNCFAALDALQHYEEAVQMAPHDALFRRTLAERAVYLGFAELAVEMYEGMASPPPGPLADAHRRAGNAAEAERYARVAAERDPLDLGALRMLQTLLSENGKRAEAGEVRERADAIQRDPGRIAEPVEVTFDPPHPVLQTGAPTDVGGATVYDHAFFSVTLTNRAGRPVEVERVLVTNTGTSAPSGMGDLVGQWTWASGQRSLGPGESATLSRTWGFTVDTDHTQLDYVFDVCWLAGDDRVRRCRKQQVELFPD